MFAKSSEEGIFLSNMHKRIIIIHMQSVKGKLVLEKLASLFF